MLDTDKIESGVKSHPEIVSLGVNCETREMILKWREEIVAHVDPNFTEKNLLSGGNNFFDWNISNPWDVINCLKTNFVEVFKRGNIISRSETDGALNYVDDIGSGIRFHHTFTRVHNFTDQDTIEREYEEKLLKIQYLISKFQTILTSNRPIFFIRRGSETLPEIRALLAALRLRRGTSRFFLINARRELLAAVPDDIAPDFVQLSVPASPAWDFELWRPVFHEIERLHAAL